MKLEKRLSQYDYFHPKFYCEDVDDPKATEDSPLRRKALPIEFPLKAEDKNDIIRLVTNYDTRERELSLAAPQIGISKRIIVFKVPMGRGVVQPFPKSVWINPEYTNITDEKEEKFDICLSVSMVAPVMRYRRIHYKAYDTTGKLVQGEAQGLTARVIQHETDHLDGILISDHAPRDKLITVPEYKQRLKDAWNGKGWIDCIDTIQKELQELRASYPPLPSQKKKKKPPKIFKKRK